jgi:CheY-like chemotaxis protein
MTVHPAPNEVERSKAQRRLLVLDSSIDPAESIRLSDSNAPSVPLHPLASRSIAVDELASEVSKLACSSEKVDAISLQIGIFTSRMGVVKQDCMPESASVAFLRVLLAEDNPVNQKFTALVLGKLGYRTDVAANGIEAVEATCRQSYDVVLMDMQMPELDGLDATRQIRVATGSATAPWIIAMTAKTSSSDCEACLAAGMNDFLSKPVGLQELETALRRAGRALGKENQVHLPFVQPEMQPGHDLSEERPIKSRLLCAAYMEDAHQTIAQLISLAEANDFASLQRKAHYLMGSSLVVGAVEVGKICSKIEKQAAAQESVLSSLEELCHCLAFTSIGLLRIPALGK